MAAVASMMMKAPAALNCDVAQRNGVGHINRLPHSSLQVKCMAKDPKESSTIKGTKLGELFAFSGPAPEIIDGRAAMVGFVSAIAVEVASGRDLLSQVSTKFGDLFAFSGPAPEIINGRAAMVGFVSAIAVEVASGRGLLSQLNNGGLSWFVLSAAILSFGSLVPMLKGILPESKSQQIFSSSAEMLNGRFAMLGLLALAFTEYIKGGALV